MKHSPLFFSAQIQAGFPSVAEDAWQEPLDLNRFLIQHPSATFFLKVCGHSMIGAGIFHEDLVIVDRSLSPVDGKIIIASLDGELTIKRLKIEHNTTYLVPENPSFPSIKISPESDFRVWGVVTFVIHKV